MDTALDTLTRLGRLVQQVEGHIRDLQERRTIDDDQVLYGYSEVVRSKLQSIDELGQDVTTILADWLHRYRRDLKP